MYLDLSDQLVGDLLAEELISLAVLHVDVELPDQLQHLVHAAPSARRDWQLRERGASPASNLLVSFLAPFLVLPVDDNIGGLPNPPHPVCLAAQGGALYDRLHRLEDRLLSFAKFDLNIGHTRQVGTSENQVELALLAAA